MDYAGKLVTLEGPEGTGKTTQADLLVQWLESRAVPVIKSKEPGTVFGGAVRQILLNPHDRPVPMAELLLFLADRAQHIETVVRPALEAGTWVVLDRFIDSTLVYQALVREVIQVHEAVNLLSRATGGLLPDLTLLLSMPYERAKARLATRESAETRIAEREGDDFERRIANAYESLPGLAPGRERFVRIDADQSVEMVSLDIRATVETRFWM